MPRRRRHLPEGPLHNLAYPRLARALASAAIVATALPAHALFIVDTGESPLPGIGLALTGDAKGAEYHQYVAAQFTVAGAYTLQSVATHLQFSPPSFNTGATFYFTLYRDAAGLPGTALFSSASINVPSGSAGAWYGASGLNWTIAAGSYWMALEAGGSSIKTIASVAGQALPTAIDAGWDPAGQWEIVQSSTPSLKIDAVAAVPEPASGLLWIGGLGLLGVAARRR